MEARLIVDEALDGAWNMACDEMMAQTAAETGTAILRFYRWAQPTLSLGYFQRYAERELHAASKHCPVVRRSSGGGALVHDQEWTYSLAIPGKHFPGSATAYRWMHDTLCRALARQGVETRIWGQETDTSREREFLCFLRRSEHDVVCAGAKVCGSAQRKRRESILQHGGVLLARSLGAPELPGIAELARSVDQQQLLGDWIDALQADQGWRFAHSQWSNQEKVLANHVLKSRFLKEAWLHRRA